MKYGFLNFFTDKKKFQYFTSAVNDFGVRSSLELESIRIPVIRLEQITSGQNSGIIIQNWEFRQGNMTLYELYSLCSIAKNTKAKNIFEIGTFDGLTTLHLSLNSEKDSRIFTLDLPPEKFNQSKFSLAAGDTELVRKEGFETGSRFRNHNAAKKIKQYYCDSAQFDYNSFVNFFDLILIDGAHSYQYIKSDTENCLKTIKRNGVILWHDYGNIQDVTDYMNELHGRLDLKKIENTSIVVYRNSG